MPDYIATFTIISWLVAGMFATAYTNNNGGK